MHGFNYDKILVNYDKILALGARRSRVFFII